MDKLHYSVVERKNKDKNAKVMETITIKDRSKKYNATLMFIGKLIILLHNFFVTIMPLLTIICFWLQTFALFIL